MRVSRKLFAAPLLLLVGCAPTPPSGTDLESLNIDPAEYGRVHHDVTRRMELESKAAANRVAPPFARKDDYGADVRVGKGPRPQFVLFIKRGCPCSIDAQPLFSRLALKYKKEVEFVGVIDKDAKAFATQFKAAFPVVEDPSLDLMRAYDARASVYCALIARNGHIVKMWPGYSAAWLEDMNALLAKAAAVEETPFDPQYAPVEKASGCPFPLTPDA